MEWNALIEPSEIASWAVLLPLPNYGMLYRQHSKVHWLLMVLAPEGVPHSAVWKNFCWMLYYHKHCWTLDDPAMTPNKTGKKHFWCVLVQLLWLVLKRQRSDWCQRQSSIIVTGVQKQGCFLCEINVCDWLNLPSQTRKPSCSSSLIGLAGRLLRCLPLICSIN